MSSIDRRHMLKIMAATAGGAAAAGAAVAGTGIESVLAASPAPSGTGVIGTPSSAATSAPTRLATTPYTTYQGFPGSDFDATSSTSTWNVAALNKQATNGGVYLRRLQLPQAALITECIFYVSNPTANVSCFLLSGNIGPNTGTYFGTGTTTVPSASMQSLPLTVTPTLVDNASFWYQLVFFATGTDMVIWGARVGWLNNPGGMTLFSNPRRLVDGFASPFTSGQTYGPFDATQQVYPIAAASGIPVGAKAAFCAVQSYTPGVLTIFPDLTTNPLIANYTATVDGPLNLTYMMVPLSPAGKFKIASYITGKVVVDAWGFVV